MKIALEYSNMISMTFSVNIFNKYPKIELDPLLISTISLNSQRNLRTNLEKRNRVIEFELVKVWQLKLLLYCTLFLTVSITI